MKNHWLRTTIFMLTDRIKHKKNYLEKKFCYPVSENSYSAHNMRVWISPLSILTYLENQQKFLNGIWIHHKINDAHWVLMFIVCVCAVLLCVLCCKCIAFVIVVYIHTILLNFSIRYGREWKVISRLKRENFYHFVLSRMRFLLKFFFLKQKLKNFICHCCAAFIKQNNYNDWQRGNRAMLAKNAKWALISSEMELSKQERKKSNPALTKNWKKKRSEYIAVRSNSGVFQSRRFWRNLIGGSRGLLLTKFNTIMTIIIINGSSRSVIWIWIIIVIFEPLCIFIKFSLWFVNDLHRDEIWYI